MKVSQIEWGPVAKAAIKEYPEKRDDIPGLAAEMAYHIIFAIFPFLIFLIFLTGIVGKIVGEQEFSSRIFNDFLSPLPAPARDTLSGPITNLLETQGGALSFGALFSALLALRSASNGVASTMKAFNRAYGVEETRNFLVKNLVALGLTLVLIVLLIGGALLLSLGGKIADALDFGAPTRIAFFVLRLVGALAGFSLALAILYWKGPNIKQQFQFISPGSVLATLMLALFTGLFGLYVNYFGQSSASKTFGAAAGVILFLTFLYWSSVFIILGAEFNAEAAKRYDPETIRDKITNPDKMLPGQQPQPHPQALREAGVTRQQVAQSDAASAEKVTSGAVGAGSGAQVAGASAMTHTPDGGIPGVLDNPEVKEKLRAIRDRPYDSAEEAARRELSRLPASEQSRRGRATVATFAVSVATAVGGVLLGARRAAQ